MYAVVKTGGKQYRVEKEDVVLVEKLNANDGDQLVLGDVLMIGDGKKVTLGTPLVNDAAVMAQVIRQTRGPKITMIYKRRRKNSRRKQGHKQDLTLLKIIDIAETGGSKLSPKKASAKTSEKKTIIDRHIIDCAQIIDFIDLNCNTTTDLGTGGGMPGLIVAIVMKQIKNTMKVNLYEKSYHKCVFLKEVSKKFNLNTEIIQKDIFTIKNIETGTIMSRAFKPMPVILNLVNNNFKSYKNIIFFMGNNGRKILNDVLNEWYLDYEEKKSLTNDDSFILNIRKIKKKIS